MDGKLRDKRMQSVAVFAASFLFIAMVTWSVSFYILNFFAIHAIMFFSSPFILLYTLLTYYKIVPSGPGHDHGMLIYTLMFMPYVTGGVVIGYFWPVETKSIKSLFFVISKRFSLFFLFIVIIGILGAFVGLSGS